MKYIFFNLIFALVFIQSFSQGTTRYTPTGVSVYAEKISELYSSIEIAAADSIWQDSIFNAGWSSAEFEGSCSSIYNCHGYALHLSDGGDTVLIPNLPDVEKYFNGINGQNATYKKVNGPMKYGKVYYNGASHSGIVDPNDISKVISKWGPGPLISHDPEECPYEDYTLEYYELIIDSLPTSVA